MFNPPRSVCRCGSDIAASDMEFKVARNHPISVDTKIMVSQNCPIIGEQVTVNFVVQKVTIATI